MAGADVNSSDKESDSDRVRWNHTPVHVRALTHSSLTSLTHGASSEAEVDVGFRVGEHSAFVNRRIIRFSIYTLSDLGVLSNLIGSLSLAN